MSYFYGYHLRKDTIISIATKAGLLYKNSMISTTLDVIRFIEDETYADIEVRGDVKGRLILSFHEDDDKTRPVTSRNSRADMAVVAKMLGIKGDPRWYRTPFMYGPDEDEYSDSEEYHNPVGAEEYHEEEMYGYESDNLEQGMSNLKVTKRQK